MTTPPAAIRAAAVLSLLAEPANHSAARTFRDQPILTWTLRRLAAANQITAIGILCWEDQVAAVRAAIPADQPNIAVLAKPRQNTAALQAVAAAQRWSDGWRGGLLQTCCFDAGFHGPWIKELANSMNCADVLLVEPSAALIDPRVLDDLLAHAADHAAMELCFTPAPPGFGAALIRAALLNRLAESRATPGRLLCYNPDQPVRDPISRDGCAPAPTSVIRAAGSYRLDSARQINRLTAALASMNGTLTTASAESIIQAAAPASTDFPREIVIELNTNRATNPIYWPGSKLDINRPPLPRDLWQQLLSELAPIDDIRLTIAGVGDPLLHDHLLDFLRDARAANIAAVQVQSDLLCDPDLAAALAAAPLDILSINIPAMTAPTYRAVMGVDALPRVLENLRILAAARLKLDAATPLLVPTFVKCRENLAEMEAWYDRWLSAVSSAVIVGPGDFARQIENHAAADMTPPRRRPCSRLAERLTILCDGSIVACEQDVLGRHPLGRLRQNKIADVWRGKLANLRADHHASNFTTHSLCANCRDWNRA